MPNGAAKAGTGAARARGWTDAARCANRSSAVRSTLHRRPSPTRICDTVSWPAAGNPRMRAAVFFLLDVSGSMSDRDRQLAKTFFFWVAAGLKREYKALDIVFVAHTTEAWEFSEPDFFKVTGTGGTVSSVGLAKMHEIMLERFDPSTCNIYLFYASDGDNASDDRAAAATALDGMARRRAIRGICGDRHRHPRLAERNQHAVSGRDRSGLPLSRFTIAGPDDVAPAVRHFFSAEAQAAAGGRGARQPMNARPPSATGADTSPRSRIWRGASASTGRPSFSRPFPTAS